MTAFFTALLVFLSVAIYFVSIGSLILVISDMKKRLARYENNNRQYH